MSSGVIHLKIVTPERVVYEHDVVSVTLPTMQGEITVLPNHIPLVSVLRPGELAAVAADQSTGRVHLAVSGGFIEVGNNTIVILADTAERAEEIDEQKAVEAHERARQLMANTKLADTVEYAQLAAKMEKELARLKVARKHRPGSHSPHIES